jgi:hypothetical protein
MANRWISNLLGTKLTEFRIRLAKLDASGLSALRTITIQNSDHTLVGRDTTDTLTNKILSLTAAHGANNTYQGTVIEGLNAGGTLSQWDVVYLGGSSTWLQADANGSGTYPARGMTVTSRTNGQAATILVYGTVRFDTWNWTPGGTIYLSTTAGGLTQTAPSASGDKIQAVGYALTADIAFFDFNSLYLTKS